MKNLKQLILKSLSWNMLNQLVSQTINLAAGICLIRMLSPEDFGLIAMVLVIIAFLSLFRNLGLGKAVIQKKDIDLLTLSSVFWIQVFTGAVLGLLFFLSSPYITAFYQEPLLEPIILYFSLEYFIGALGMLQFARLEKKLNYRLIFYINIISIFCSGLAGILLALNGFGYWSLVAKSFLLTFLNTCLVWVFSGWRPAFELDLTKTKQLFHFSLPLLGNQLLNFGVRNIDDLLIGKVLGQRMLGLYNRSYNLMLFPLTNISKVISNVLFPALSIIQDELQKIKQIYLNTIQVVALITFPLMIGLFALVEPFVLLVFGDQWLDIIPVMKVLSILGMFQSVGVFNGVIFMALGKTLLLFKIEVFSKSFMIAMIIIGVFYTRDPAGVALFYTFASILAIFPSWYFMGKLIGTKIKEILHRLFAIFSCAVSMGLFIYFMNDYFFSDSPNLLTFLWQIIAGAIFYLLLLVLFRIKAYEALKKIIRNKLFLNEP